MGYSPWGLRVGHDLARMRAHTYMQKSQTARGNWQNKDMVGAARFFKAGQSICLFTHSSFMEHL